MSHQPFAGTRAPSQLVNRAQEMTNIREAIYQPGDRLRVVLIEGEGGLGKTRMLREVLWRAGHPDERKTRGTPAPEQDWTQSGEVILSDLIDFVDVRLHTFTRFLSALRDALRGSGVNFPRYDAARAKHQQQIAAQADYRTLTETRNRAEAAFFEDCKEIARARRIVWLLDTAEQIGFVASEWLLKRHLLKPEELSFETQGRLLELFSKNALPNTTILIAGRGEEGKRFFSAIQKIAEGDAEGGSEAFELKTIPVKPLNERDTQTYFRVLADDWRREDPNSEIAAYMQHLADDTDRAWVFWLYTGGQPVRLSLYADILAEGKAEPEPLQETVKEAKQRVQWDDQHNKPAKKLLEEAQFEIEGQFIQTLFASAGTLRAKILLALVRARRGLDSRRLHLILDRRPGDKLEGWVDDLRRLEEIEIELKAMQALSFVKRRPDGRIVLQDEIYRIYDKHAAANQEARLDETQARHQLYGQLVDFAEQEIRNLRQQQLEDWKEYERSLQFETLSPARAVMMRFRELDEEEREERNRLRDRVRDTELERLHYILRRDPDSGFNDKYFELADRLWLANDEEAIAQAQAELWRFLTDPYVRDFIAMPESEVRSRRKENNWDVLVRAAEQEDVVRWLKRFVLRGAWQRAIQLANDVEKAVEELTGHVQISWKHSLSLGERASWREYARVLLGGKDETLQAIAALEGVADNLVQLSRRGIAEKKELGFAHHPAETRLRRIIGVTYNNLGYAYVTIGQFRQAIAAYANALPYLRESRFEVQQAVTSNNLARALSESGLPLRAARICRDALELHERLGAEPYMAYAHNTLALIFNDALTPEEAWLEAAIAAAYFRRLGYARGIGLSLLQLGEALRRLSTSDKTLPDTPVELQEAAEQVLQEALGIFTDEQSPFSKEIIRRIEAKIEIGCLFRDRSRSKKYSADPVRQDRRRREALRHLAEAVDLAGKGGYSQLQLVGQVNVAWTHFFAGEPETAEAALQTAQTLIPEQSIFRPGELPPAPDAVEGYFYQQLSKMWVLRGRIAFDRFHHRTDEEIRSQIADRVSFHLAVSQDAEASQRLREASEAFTLALAYAQLFAPRSGALITAYANLHSYLKKFSVVAMIDFTKYQQEAQDKYRVAEIKTRNLVDMREFLLQCFGDYSDYQMLGDEM